MLAVMSVLTWLALDHWLMSTYPIVAETEAGPVPRLLQLLMAAWAARRSTNFHHPWDLAVWSVEGENVIEIKVL
jgi:hypothetical protein